MVTMDLKSPAMRVAIVRILEVIFVCITFSLAASAGLFSVSFSVWCMFTWCFCFVITIVILILELTGFSSKLPISWDDFTAAFSMLATLMVLAASVIYPKYFACPKCSRQIGASVTSCIAFILYAVEVGLNRAKPGEISGFLATIPGLLKVLEAFVACIIFICLDNTEFTFSAGLQWCVAVYSICFIFALLIIIFTIGRLLSLFPAPFQKVLMACNVLAVLMYITALVIFPVFYFRKLPATDMPVVIAVMTAFNLVAYIVDTVYSVRLVFFVTTQTESSAAMIHIDLHSLTQPVGIIRIIAAVLSCMCFSLAATAASSSSSYWAWCIFTWCFCCFFTLLIVILELTTVNTKVPFAWDDFTNAFAMLASVMYLTVSIIYPTFFTCNECHRAISASVISWVCFGIYVAEVVLTHLRPRGETSGFLSTLPGIMKMLETFITCLIFVSLETSQYTGSPGKQWCVAVYSLCFIFAIVIILLTLGQMTSFFPFSFDYVVIVYNILASVMYGTAMVIWPLYSFPGNYRPSNCGHICSWDKLVVVTFMTIFNFILYTLDSAYSIRLVFISNR
ncbi:uncharacterized protein KZ484_003150 [Pholidichthys leucotaenia]